ncbi:MAG: hypothetical protein ACOZBZ_02340 [Patescibacteria group bacterium]
MRKEILSHLVPTLVFLVFLTLLHWQLKFSLIFFWLGASLGAVVLDLDHLLYTFIQAPHEFTSQRAKRFFEQRKFWEGIILLFETQEERGRMIFHSVLFQVILVILTFFVLTSSASLFGKGLVLGMLLHSLTDQGFEFVKNGEIENWFWQFRQKPAVNLQALYLAVIFLLFLILSLLLI